jgi:hypothetical protein
MAVDKLVDSTQLDADLTSVANAIRTKGGTSAQLAFPTGFVDAIDAIPTGGGGDTVTKIINGTVTSITDSDATLIRTRCFEQCTSLISVTLPNVTVVKPNAFNDASNLASVSMKKVQILDGSFCFSGCNKLKTIVLPALETINGSFSFRNDSMLESADLGAPNNLQQQTFASCTKLKTLILRKANGVCALGGANSFTGTPFASGGSGGTIYIPKALYDHLGDGTALDYKAATNWSTIDGYGTITWAQIEGSIYETQYADGTPIT